MGLIDRDGERRQIGSFLDEAGPGARALVLRGDAGIGKTTLWQSAVESAGDRGYRVLLTRATEAEARLPFAGLHDLFADAAPAADPVLPPPQQLALDVALMRVAPDTAPMPPLALPIAVLELLRALSRARPLVIAVDDLQWLDPSSAGALRFALRRLTRERVFVIATERASADASAPSLADDLLPDRLLTLAVGPLTAELIGRLLDDSLGLRLAPPMLRRVHAMTGGNPLHALEVGRALQARGLDQATGRIALPETLAQLLRGRLAALTPDARVVVNHAAALTHPTLALLEAALGPDRIAAGLRAARDADVLAAGDDPIRFTHPLLMEQAYAGMRPAERRDVHRLLATVVTEPEEQACHLALAGSGPDPVVASALDAASVRARSRGAPDAAAELAELAARLTAVDDVLRARRMAEAGRQRLLAGDAVRARELLERALDEPAAAGGTGRAELLHVLGFVRQLMDDFAAAAELGREALAHAGDDPTVVVKAKLLVAGAAFITGRDWTDGAGHALDAVELAAATNDRGLMATAIGTHASWRYATGHGLDPDAMARAAALSAWTERVRALDDPDFAIAGIEMAEGMTVAGSTRLRRLLERAERDGDYSSLPFLLASCAAADFLEGNAGVARDRLRQAMTLAQMTDQRTAQLHVLVYDVRIASRLGHADRALAAAREAHDLIASTGWRMREWLMRADVAVLELSRGDAAAALAHVEAATGRGAEDEDAAGRRRVARGVAVEALVALGRHEEARSTLEILEEEAASDASQSLGAEALRARARLLAATGDADGAEAAARDAEARYRGMDDRWELARTLLVVADGHRRARRRASARTALREALEAFTFLGARLWANEAREQLRRIDATRESGGLTPTQQRVAEHVADGLTNRQVADRLSMSPHTVEAHLSAIYRTLEIGSRRELKSAMAGGDGGPIRDSAA